MPARCLADKGVQNTNGIGPQRMRERYPFFDKLFSDPLYVRVCIFLWGTLFLGIGLFLALSASSAQGGLVSQLLGLAFFSTIGIYLISVTIFGRKETIEVITGFTNTIDLVGALLLFGVALIAIPITLVLRSIQRDFER